MLEKMTESLFAATLKRIAEDTWKVKFQDIYENLTKRAYRSEVDMNEFVTKVMIEILKGDPELQAKFKEAFSKSLESYLDDVLRKK